MKMRSCMLFIISISMIAMMTLIASGLDEKKEGADLPPTREFSGGTGVPSDPYIITNVTELQMMNTALMAHFVLANDIDAYATSTWNGGQGFVPIGRYTRFMGSLDGRNHTINGLYINDPENNNIGMFGQIDPLGSVRFLHLLDVNIAGKAYVGGLADLNQGTLINVTVEGDINGYSMTGGMTSRNYGDMVNCSFRGTVNVEGSSYSGGICSRNNGDIIGCHASCSLTSSKDYVGGITGQNSGTIERCQMMGNVTGTTFTGGISGYSEGMVMECFSTAGVLSLTTDVGGLMGFNSGSVSDCYSTGNVTGQFLVGGLIGTSSGNVVRSYSTGKVTGGSNTGGLVGSGAANSNCFFDNITSGWTTSASGTGRNTTEMKKYVTFNGAGWDMTDVWQIVEDVTYPFLRMHYYGPVFSNFQLPDALEDHDYHFDASSTVDVFDYPGTDNEVSFSIDTDADWLEISMKGILSGTPDNSDVGIVDVTIKAQDSQGLTGSETVQLEILNTNDPPIITTAPILTTLEDEGYTLELNAEDIDPTSDSLTFLLDTDAGWLTLSNMNDTLYGTPANDHVGAYRVNVTVHDGNGGRDHLNFTLEVEN
ncbi:MAG: cadherin-like domain-containing protein, partial [Candidatus Thermoplasmatota archaeon]|nr:cadherin-like domain-containing protein [Candidatus Thermoplasmatota archaeon]